MRMNMPALAVRLCVAMVMLMAVIMVMAVIVPVVVPGVIRVRRLPEPEPEEKAAEHEGSRALFLEAHLAQCSLQPVRQPLRIVVRPEVHEEKPGLLAQHVAVQRRDL